VVHRPHPTLHTLSHTSDGLALRAACPCAIALPGSRIAATVVTAARPSVTVTGMESPPLPSPWTPASPHGPLLHPGPPTDPLLGEAVPRVTGEAGIRTGLGEAAVLIAVGLHRWRRGSSSSGSCSSNSVPVHHAPPSRGDRSLSRDGSARKPPATNAGGTLRSSRGVPHPAPHTLSGARVLCGTAHTCARRSIVLPCAPLHHPHDRLPLCQAAAA
jgi:hypothetical protein